MMLHERLDAISASRVDGPSKLVLIMLAKRLDRDDPDGVVWSSSETLAEECGVSARAICHTMKRLTAAGIIRIVSKAAQGRTARKAIDWAVLAAAERDATAIENIPAEKRRRVRSRSDEPSDLEVTDSQTLALRGVTPRSDEPSEDPIIDPPMNPILESDQDTRSDASEPSPDQRAEPEPPMHSLIADDIRRRLTGSRPTTDTDPIDNDGAQTPIPGASRPLSPATTSQPEPEPRRPEASSVEAGDPRWASGDASTLDDFIDAWHRDEIPGPLHDALGMTHAEYRSWVESPAAYRAAMDAKPGELVIVSGRPTPIRCGDCSDRGWSCDREQGHDGPHASTPTAAPATTTATAPPPLAAPSVVAPNEGQGGAGAFIWLDEPAPAPKRTPKSKSKTKGKPDEAAILAIAAQVDRLKGRPGAALPGSGRWKMLVAAVGEAGADRVLARVTAMADAAQGLPSPARAVFAAMSGSDWGTDPILRGNNGWTVKLDDAIDAQRASEATGAAGGGVGRVESQNARQGQPAPNPAVSWSDVLRDIGSDPRVHPEDGPHRHRWQSVRQAVIVAAKKPGDPWLNWCNADDRTRQHVEQLLERGLVRVSA